MNFNPKKVIASKKACMEYARMLGKYDLQFNKGLKVDNKERLWYTPSIHQKAASTTADDIGKEKGKSNKQSKGRMKANTKSKPANPSTLKIKPIPKSKKQQPSLIQSRAYKEQDDKATISKSKQKQKIISKKYLNLETNSDTPIIVIHEVNGKNVVPRPRFIPITDDVEESINLILHKASLCPGSEELLNSITPDFM